MILFYRVSNIFGYFVSTGFSNGTHYNLIDLNELLSPNLRICFFLILNCFYFSESLEDNAHWPRIFFSVFRTLLIMKISIKMEEFLSVNVEKYYNQNDLTSKNNNYNFTKPKWKLRKNRRKQIILFQTSLLQGTFFILCFCLLLPVPHNAMPVPKVEDENSLTSAMVRLFFLIQFFCNFHG